MEGFAFSDSPGCHATRSGDRQLGRNQGKRLFPMPPLSDSLGCWYSSGFLGFRYKRGLVFGAV